MGKAINGKELGKGITQRKNDGLYQARFTNRLGKKVTLYDTNLVELKKKFNKAKSEDKELHNPIAGSMSVDELFVKWIEVYKKGKVRNTTYMSYSRTYNLVRDDIGYMKLSDVNNLILQASLNKLDTDSSREKVRKLLSDMFKKAVVNDLIVKNPAVGLTTEISKDKKSREAMSREEASLFIRKADELGCKYYNYFVLALETGMRQGELNALRWENVDLENRLIYVRETFVYYSTPDGLIKEIHNPKTQAGVRDIPLTQKAVEVLKEQRKQFVRVDDEFGSLVFRSQRGEPVKQHAIQNSINIIIREIRKERDFNKITPHVFRHTFATRCIENGMQPKTLQYLLGHSSIKMSLDLYTHVMKDTIRDEMLKMELPESV